MIGALRPALLLSVVLLAGLIPGALAQGAPPSAAKKALVQQVLRLSQPGIEALGAQLAAQTAGQALQAAGASLGPLPADRREAVAGQIQADVRRFYDEIAPLLRGRALDLAPATLGATLETRFTEAELEALVAWLESPVSRKFQQVAAEQQQALAQRLVEDTRPQVEPKIRALEKSIAARLKAATPAKAAPTPKK